MTLFCAKYTYRHMPKEKLDNLLSADVVEERKAWEEEKNRKMAKQRRAREVEEGGCRVTCSACSGVRSVGNARPGY